MFLELRKLKEYASGERQGPPPLSLLADAAETIEKTQAHAQEHAMNERPSTAAQQDILDRLPEPKRYPPIPTVNPPRANMICEHGISVYSECPECNFKYQNEGQTWETKAIRKELSQVDARILQLQREREAERRGKVRYAELLGRIYGLLPPGDADAPGGRRFRFEDPDANETLRRLKIAILQIVEELKQ